MWRPRRPYATDDYALGMWRTSRDRASRLRHVEMNAPGLVNVLTVDIDQPDALLRAVWDRDGWRPNVVVENPLNGHAHAIWALQAPVPTTEYARRKPLALAAALTEGLRRSVDGDAGYSGLMGKNPLHADWNAHQFTDHLYLFEELQEHLDAAGFMPSPSWSRSKARNTTGLGRNCHLFETVRTWAYPQINHCWGDPQKLGELILNHALTMNLEFPEPLPTSEVRAVAASITRWITTRSKMWRDGKAASDARFSARQARRGVRSGRVRQDAAQQRYERIRQLSGQGMSQRQIAAALGCSQGTVANALKR